MKRTEVISTEGEKYHVTSSHENLGEIMCCKKAIQRNLLQSKRNTET